MPRAGERDLQVAEARVDRLGRRAGDRGELAPAEGTLGDEEERLELGLGQVVAGEARRRAAPVVADRGGLVGTGRGSLGAARGRPPAPRRSRVLLAGSRRWPARPPATGPTGCGTGRTMMGPHGPSCSTVTSRRLTSSSIARNVTATTTRSRTPASRSCRTTGPASASAARMSAARSARVIVRGMASGGGTTGGATAASRSSAPHRSAGSRRGGSGAIAPRRAAASATDGSRRDQAPPGEGPRLQGGRGVAVGPVGQQPGAQRRLRVGLVVERDGGVGRARQEGPALDEDELAGDGDEGREVAEAVALEAGDRVEVRLGERAEGHGHDVEAARLDERQEEPQRPLPLGEADVGGVLGPATRGEGDRRRRRRAGAADRRRAVISWPRRQRGARPAARGIVGRDAAPDQGRRPRRAARRPAPAPPSARRGRAGGPSRRRRRAAAPPAACTHGPSSSPSDHATRCQRRIERPLPASWKRPARSRSRSSDADRAERRHDVEAVAPVGDRHAVEEGELGGRQPLGQRGALHGPHPRRRRAGRAGGP